MKAILFAPLLMFGLFNLSGCSWLLNLKAQADLKALCSIADEFGSKEEDKLTRARKFSEKVDKQIAWGPIHEMMQALATAEPSQKWRLIQMGAFEVGVENYQCPSLQEIYYFEEDP